MGHRIASLLPSATELLFAVGAGGEVVAVTHECDHPAEARGLPAVTRDLLDNAGQSSASIDRHIRAARHQGSSIYALDAERLGELAPDLIVTQELCDVCAVAYREVAQTVRSLPGDIEVLSLEPASLADIITAAVVLGEATGHRAEGAALAASMQRRIDELSNGGDAGSSPRVVCVEWTEPLMVGGHWIPEMVQRAGGVDVGGVAGEPSRYLEWDQVVAADPEVMLLMPCGHGLERTLELAGELTGRPGFHRLACAQQGRMVAVDGSAYFNRPGPRIVHGLEILVAALWSAPASQLPDGAAWVTSLPAAQPE